MADVPHVVGDIGTQRTERLEWWIASVAGRQHGVISHEQLLALGLSASAIQKRVMSGRLHVVHRGVYAVGHTALGLHGRFMAAALTGGPTAMISHRSAAALHGILDDHRAVIDVVTTTRRRSRKGIAFHETRGVEAEDRVRINNIPVTSLPRTLLDIAEVVPQRRLVYALERTEMLRLLDTSAIHSVIARSSGRRGIKPLRAALNAIHPEALYAHPGLERRFLSFCSEWDVPTPAMNAVVEGLTVDALWREQRVIAELDSWTYHRTRSAFEQDRRRDAILKLAGYEVLRITDRWLTDDPAQVAAILKSLLSAP